MYHQWKRHTFALLLTGTMPAAAQTGEDSAAGGLPSEDLGEIVLFGIRPGLASAQEIKRTESGIVDAVVAAEMDKLPDLSVTESLARVTGVQIARDRGEGGAVTIRGLTQMETTLNGRELFTAGSGRNFDFSDLPAEQMAAIRVYKSAAADRIEGGIGGSVDLRTRRPFDFEGDESLLSAGLLYGDLIDESRGHLSLLASRRGRLGAGEAGLLISLSHQDRPWREEIKSAGAPLARDDLIPGRTLLVPNGTSETTSVGHRERNAADLVLEWRPAPALELYAEGRYLEFSTWQDSYQINISPSPNAQPGSVSLFPGTSDVAQVTWLNAPVSILSFDRDTRDRTGQAALGGRWQGEALTLRFDASWTESSNRLTYQGPILSGRAGTFSHDLAASPPATAVTGSDLLDPANLSLAGLSYRYRPFDGTLGALRLEAEYLPAEGPFDTLTGGLRLARRHADNGSGLIYGDVPVENLPAAGWPGWFRPNPYPDFFPGAGGIGHYLVGDLRIPWNSPELREQLGITPPLPTAGSPLGRWHIDEATDAAWLMGEFEHPERGLAGNLGLRAVATRTSLFGHRSLPESGGVGPIAVDNSYLDYLPSLNLRADLADRLTLRAAAAKSLTRPDFDQLSPSLTLLRNSVTPSLNQGRAGNPELEPVRADNLDLALDYHFARDGALTVTGFWKQVDGFIQQLSAPELHDGQLYQVSRPYNARSAGISGVELGYQQFFTALPGPLGGLGLAANYTCIESETDDPILGAGVPLQNLSRHSGNLVGLYERGPLSARLAYNWRDRFVSRVIQVVGVGALPVYTEAYGWLDASISYRIDREVTLTLAGSNLLGTVRNSYYGEETRPESSWLNDTQLTATVTVRL